MSESETTYVERQATKHALALKRQLRRIDLRGDGLTTEQTLTLIANDLIAFGGPREDIGNPYNCYRLTPDGKRKLEDLA